MKYILLAYFILSAGSAKVHVEVGTTNPIMFDTLEACEVIKDEMEEKAVLIKDAICRPEVVLTFLNYTNENGKWIFNKLGDRI